MRNRGGYMSFAENPGGSLASIATQLILWGLTIYLIYKIIKWIISKMKGVKRASNNNNK